MRVAWGGKGRGSVSYYLFILPEFETGQGDVRLSF